MFRISAAAGPLLRGRRVFCGFSGGSDSLYLLLALKEISAPFHFSLEAIHFEHGLRGDESRADAEWCREKCRKENIPCTVISLHVKEKQRPGEGEEAAARRLRLEQWRSLLSAAPGALVALGHNAGDRMENLFLRLFRGANATGLTALRLRSQVDSVEFIRPLLELSKQEIEETLQAAGEVWRIDSTNLQPEIHRRNALRLTILPAIENAFPSARKGILHSLAAVECDADFLEHSAMDAYQRMKQNHAFAPADWNALHRALFCRVLRYFLRDRLGMDFIPDYSLLERFGHAVAFPPENGEFRIVELKEEPEHFLCVERDRVSVRSRSAGTPPLLWNRKERQSVSFGRFELTAERVEEPLFGDPFSAFFSEDLPSVLRISVREDGERMIPFGKHSPVPLKKLFSDAKIKAYERDSYPVLRLPDGAILWIPGVKRSLLLPAGDGACIRIRVRKRD